LAQVSRKDIWLFVYEKEKVRYTDLIREFVDAGKCARQTLTNYKRDLERSGKLGKKIDEETRRPVYFVPEEFREKAKKLLEERNVRLLIGSFETKWLSVIRSMLIHLLTKLKKFGVSSDQLIENQGFMVIPMKRPPRPSAPPAVFTNIVFFPLEEKALLKVVKYVKEEQWIR